MCWCHVCAAIQLIIASLHLERDMNNTIQSTTHTVNDLSGTVRQSVNQSIDEFYTDQLTEEINEFNRDLKADISTGSKISLEDLNRAWREVMNFIINDAEINNRTKHQLQSMRHDFTSFCSNQLQPWARNQHLSVNHSIQLIQHQLGEASEFFATLNSLQNFSGEINSLMSFVQDYVETLPTDPSMDQVFGGVNGMVSGARGEAEQELEREHRIFHEVTQVSVRSILNS